MIGVLLLFCKKKKRCAPNASGSNREEKKKGELLYYLDVVLSSSSLPSLLPVLCARLLLQKKPLCLSLSLRFVTSISRALQPPLVVVGIIWNVVERIERIKWDKKEREWRRKKGCGWEGLETRFHLFWLYSIRQKKNRWIRERREGPAWLKGATRQIPIFNVHSTSNLACVCVYARVCVCGEAVLVGKSGKCCGWEKNFSNLHLVVESHGLA